MTTYFDINTYSLSSPPIANYVFQKLSEAYQTYGKEIAISFTLDVPQYEIDGRKIVIGGRLGGDGTEFMGEEEEGEYIFFGMGAYNPEQLATTNNQRIHRMANQLAYTFGKGIKAQQYSSQSFWSKGEGVEFIVNNQMPGFLTHRAQSITSFMPDTITRKQIEQDRKLYTNIKDKIDNLKKNLQFKGSWINSQEFKDFKKEIQDETNLPDSFFDIDGYVNRNGDERVTGEQYTTAIKIIEDTLTHINNYEQEAWKFASRSWEHADYTTLMQNIEANLDNNTQIPQHIKLISDSNSSFPNAQDWFNKKYQEAGYTSERSYLPF